MERQEIEADRERVGDRGEERVMEREKILRE